MNISHEPHDYQPVFNTLKILTLGISRPNDCINYIISGSFDVPILWSRVWFRMPIEDKRAPTVKTNYLEADPLRKVMSLANRDNTILKK